MCFSFRWRSGISLIVGWSSFCYALNGQIQSSSTFLPLNWRAAEPAPWSASIGLGDPRIASSRAAKHLRHARKSSVLAKPLELHEGVEYHGGHGCASRAPRRKGMQAYDEI